jgi:hypothetical protein
MRTSKESSVLRPLDPSIHDSDDFPIFTLSQVEIVDGEHELTSLLNADVKNPVTITGKLDHVPSVKFLLPSVSCPVTIEVIDVRTSSYGQMEEGEVAIWALGKAGWFQLKPSRRYRDVYKGMVEAVVMFYFLADAYRELRKKDTPPTAETSLEKYAEEPSHDCSNAMAAEAVLKKHRRFLMTSMQKRAENINWKSTPIFRFLKSMVPKVSSTQEDTTMTEPPTQYEEEDTTHIYTAGKGKGKTHPKSGKLSLKGQAQANEDRSILEDVSMTDIGMDSTLALHTESTAARAKRKQAETRRQQRYLKRHKLDEETAGSTIIISPSDPSETTITEPIFEPINPSIPVRRSKQKIPIQHIRIVDEPLPSYLAEGPDGIWRCSFDGCSKVIYGVTDDGDDDDEPKQLIREHYRKHAFESQKKLDLIYKEERPYLPVGNLVKRIRELAAAKGAADATTKPVAVSGSNGYAAYKATGKMECPEPIQQAGY